MAFSIETYMAELFTSLNSPVFHENHRAQRLLRKMFIRTFIPPPYSY